MEYEIRECRVEDVEAIWRLNCAQMGYVISLEPAKENLVRLLSNGAHKILVAEMHGNVVGYVHANDYDLLYYPHMKNIMGIAVDEAYKKHGIGKALISTIETWAKDTGAVAVRLVSGAERTDAHAFYEKCGYTGGKKQINFKKIL